MRPDNWLLLNKILPIDRASLNASYGSLWLPDHAQCGRSTSAKCVGILWYLGMIQIQVVPVRRVTNGE